MRGYILKRLLQAAIVIPVLITVVFLVTHAMGDPVRLMLGPGAGEEAVEALRHQLGLDQPLHVQFWEYVKGLSRLDFGKSLWLGQPAMEAVVQRMPATFLLAITAIGWATIAGILTGAFSARRPFGVVDRTLSTINFFAVSSIDFWLALLLIIGVAIRVPWIPTSGYGTANHLILPALALGFRSFGRISQVTRPAVIDEFSKPYVLALRARGLSEAKVMFHGLKNVSVVILTLVGLELVRLFYGAAVVIETIFAWPGVGFLIVQAAERRDWTLLSAATVIIAVIVIAFHLILDLLYAWLNPRVRVE
jgi:peptide/nickel transport system permease protein